MSGLQIAVGVAARGTVRFHGVAGQGEVPVAAVTTEFAGAVAGADLVRVGAPDSTFAGRRLVNGGMSVPLDI